MRLLVIGGGISGLTTATLAQAAGHEVTCVDPAPYPGGLIRSERHEGFLCEVGPQAVLAGAPATAALIAAAGLTERTLVASAAARRRLIYTRGALHPLPSSPPALLASGLLSLRGKLRLLREPFIPARRPVPDDDAETVTAFGYRRLGRDATDRLLATAVIGIYAAEAATLSLGGAFPRLAAMERAHGSLFKGMLAARKGRGRADPDALAPGRPLSFPDGLAELPTALAKTLGTALVLGKAVALEPRATGGWRVMLETAAAREVDAVVVATDAATAAQLLGPFLPEARFLATLPVAPVALCCLGFRDADARPLGMDLQAYGFLVARGEGPRLLGCQYESSTFSGRAPPGGVLLRAILGGLGDGFQPDIVDASDEEIIRRAVEDLGKVAGLTRAPDLARVWRHPAGIPQYRPGHARQLAALDAALARHLGLHALGHALRGAGVNECIRAATKLVATFPPG